MAQQQRPNGGGYGAYPPPYASYQQPVQQQQQPYPPQQQQPPYPQPPPQYGYAAPPVQQQQYVAPPIQQPHAPQRVVYVNHQQVVHQQSHVVYANQPARPQQQLQHQHGGVQIPQAVTSALHNLQQPLNSAVHAVQQPFKNGNLHIPQLHPQQQQLRPPARINTPPQQQPLQIPIAVTPPPPPQTNAPYQQQPHPPPSPQPLAPPERHSNLPPYIIGVTPGSPSAHGRRNPPPPKDPGPPTNNTFIDRLTSGGKCDAQQRQRALFLYESISRGVDLAKRAAGVHGHRVPSWKGRKLGVDEADVGIIFSPPDEPWSLILAETLHSFGLKVCTDPVKVHRTRASVIVISEITGRYESAVRLITNAAERFNQGDNLIVTVLHPGTKSDFMERLPDNLAYSLSNTVTVKFDDILQEFDANFTIMYDTIKDHVRGNLNPNLSGTWHLSAMVSGDGGSERSMLREFAVIFNHAIKDGIITAKMANGKIAEAEVDGEFLNLRFGYTGYHIHGPEMWSLENGTLVAQARMRILNQGNRLEGWYADNMDEQGLRSGPISGTREVLGLSGLWSIKTPTTEAEMIFVHHFGGTKLSVEGANSFGEVFRGTLFGNNISLFQDWPQGESTMQVALDVNTDDRGRKVMKFAGTRFYRDFKTVSRIDKVSGDNRTSTVFKLPRITFPIPELKERMKASDQLRPRLSNISEFSSHIKRTRPLEDNEFATTIHFSPPDIRHAVRLHRNLIKSGISPIGFSSIPEDLRRPTRSAIVILSTATRNDTTLCQNLVEIAKRGIRVFNIGLNSWGEIFGGVWPNPALLSDVRSALAGFNQSGSEAVDRHGRVFHALARAVRRTYEGEVGVMADGIWYLRPAKIDVQIVHSGRSKPEWTVVILHVAVERGAPMRENCVSISGVCANGSTWRGMIDVDTKEVMIATVDHRTEYEAFQGYFDPDNGELVGTFTRGNPARLEYEVFGTVERSGLSGHYSGGGKTFTLAHYTGSRCMLQYGNEIRAGVVIETKTIFTLPNGPAGDEITYVCTATRSEKSGLILNGCGSQSTGTFHPSVAFERAFTIFDSFYAVVRDKFGTECPNSSVTRLVTTAFETIDSEDFYRFQALWKNKATNEDFTEQVRINKLYGRVKKIHYMGEAPIGDSTRYEWLVIRSNCKYPRIIATTISSAGALTYLADREDEARLFRLSNFDVMISYRSINAGFVDILQQFLQGEGLTVWRDQLMETGTNWSSEITNAVRTSNMIVSCLSDDYVTSPLCTKEIRIGKDSGRHIIPIVLPRTEQTVKAPYMGKTVPPTLAREMSDCTMIDLRDANDRTIKDPASVSDLLRQFSQPMNSLVNQIVNIKVKNEVWDVTGTWKMAFVEGFTRVGKRTSFSSSSCELRLRNGFIEGSVGMVYKTAKLSLKIISVASMQVASRFNILAYQDKTYFFATCYLGPAGDKAEGVFCIVKVVGGDVPYSLMSRGSAVADRLTEVPTSLEWNAFSAMKSGDMDIEYEVSDDEETSRMIRKMTVK